MTSAYGPPAGFATREHLPSRRKIVVADADDDFRGQVRRLIEPQGFDVAEVGAVDALWRILSQDAADLVVLDLALVGEEGLSVCRRITGDDGPALVLLSASAGVAERIEGLEFGADDFLGKPCNPRELLARVRAVLRRRPEAAASSMRATYREFAGWRLDLIRRRLLSPRNLEVPLSDTEFNLLRGLVEQPQRILSRAELLAFAPGAGKDVSDKGVDVQVSRLRRKFDDGAGRKLIRTVRNAGYIFTAVVG